MGQGLTRLVAVIVDDEPTLLALLAELLEEEGFSVIQVADPRWLLENGASPEPAIFLVDMMMPGITGIQLAERLRLGPFPHTPMIALSAAPSMLRQAVESGWFTAVLQKPFDLNELVGLIGAHVGQ